MLVNIAKNQPTVMSSTWKVKTSSKNAVDGNVDHFISGGSCAVTKTQNNPWFRIDIQNSTAVSGITYICTLSNLKFISSKST